LLAQFTSAYLCGLPSGCADTKRARRERVLHLLKDYAAEKKDSTGQKYSLRDSLGTKYVKDGTSPASTARIKVYELPVNCNLDTEAYNWGDSRPIGLIGSPHEKAHFLNLLNRLSCLRSVLSQAIKIYRSVWSFGPPNAPFIL